MANSGDPCTLADVTSMLDKLPSIIAEARYAELWGTQLDNDDDRNREIVIEKVRLSSGSRTSTTYASAVPRAAFHFTHASSIQSERFA